MQSINFALFQSYLNYGLRVWGQLNECDLRKIEVFQNKAIRAITGASKEESCSRFYKELGITKLKDVFFYKFR